VIEALAEHVPIAGPAPAPAPGGDYLQHLADAWQHLDAGETALCRRACYRALALQLVPEPWEIMAAALARFGDIEGAAEAFGAALALAPDNADIRYNLAACYTRQGRWDEADQQLAEVLRIDPEHQAARVAVGVAA
jgi:tetratricopeptide (TPR) repeat protein